MAGTTFVQLINNFRYVNIFVFSVSQGVAFHLGIAAMSHFFDAVRRGHED